MCRSTACLPFCVASSSASSPLRRAQAAATLRALVLVLVLALSAAAARAAVRGLIARPAIPESPATSAQQEPELRSIVQAAIGDAQCFADRYDSAVWFTLMEPRLRRFIADHDARIAMLQVVYCETHRAGATPLPPGLVLAVMEVESRFDRWAVSSAGAVGLMQVMPFWPEQLGMRRRELVTPEPNIRMGCAILRHYLEIERNDVRRALARYNGSTGHREYPDRVVTRWTRFWAGADDLGRAPLKPS